MLLITISNNQILKFKILFIILFILYYYLLFIYLIYIYNLKSTFILNHRNKITQPNKIITKILPSRIAIVHSNIENRKVYITVVGARNWRYWSPLNNSMTNVEISLWISANVTAVCFELVGRRSH